MIRTTPTISTRFLPIGINIVISQTHFIVKENKISIGNLVENIIHLNIRHNLIPINCINNHNLLNTTEVNSIFKIEKHTNLVPRMMIIKKIGKT